MRMSKPSCTQILFIMRIICKVSMSCRRSSPHYGEQKSTSKDKRFLVIYHCWFGDVGKIPDFSLFGIILTLSKASKMPQHFKRLLSHLNAVAVILKCHPLSEHLHLSPWPLNKEMWIWASSLDYEAHLMSKRSRFRNPETSKWPEMNHQIFYWKGRSGEDSWASTFQGAPDLERKGSDFTSSDFLLQLTLVNHDVVGMNCHHLFRLLSEAGEV